MAIKLQNSIDKYTAKLNKKIIDFIVKILKFENIKDF